MRFIQLLTEDYSPGNQVVTFKPGQPLLQLEKETTSQIVEARVYSDLVGIDDDQPNGLIQVEVWKKLVLNTKNFPVFSESNPNKFKGKAEDTLTWRQKPYHIAAYGTLFSHITPRLRLSDINDKNNPLITTPIELAMVGTDPDTVQAIHPLRLFQYSNLNIGTSLGLFDLTVNNLKSTFSIAFDGFLSRSNVYFGDTNSLAKVNSILLGPSFSWRINPQTHTEAMFTYRIDYMDALVDDLVTTTDTARYIDRQKEYLGNKLFHSLHFAGIWRVREEKGYSDKISLRASFHVGAKSFNTNFFQFQIGYTMNLSMPNKIPQFKG